MLPLLSCGNSGLYSLHSCSSLTGNSVPVEGLQVIPASLEAGPRPNTHPTQASNCCQMAGASEAQLIFELSAPRSSLGAFEV